MFDLSVGLEFSFFSGLITPGFTALEQSSATPSLHLGLWKIVACSQPYLAVPSCIYSFWYGVISSFLMIFTHI